MNKKEFFASHKIVQDNSQSFRKTSCSFKAIRNLVLGP